MAYTSIPSTLYDIGDPVKRELFQTTAENMDDHETRINLVETGAKKHEFFSGGVSNASSASSLTGLDYWIVPFDMVFSEAKIGIFEKGSLTGTLEIDVRKSASLDDTGAVSLFTTRPSIDIAAASDYDQSTNAVIDTGTNSLSEGDVIFLDITSLPSNGILGKFSLILIGEI